MDFNLETFIEEFYKSQRRNLINEYTSAHWETALELFESPLVMDNLIDICWECMSKNDDEAFEKVKAEYLQKYGKADES